jgi:hypothetical protein
MDGQSAFIFPPCSKQESLRCGVDDLKEKGKYSTEKKKQKKKLTVENESLIRVI